MRERWNERSKLYKASVAADIEEEKRREEENRIQNEQRMHERALLSLEHERRVEEIDELYEAEIRSAKRSDTAPLLLGTVLSPVVEKPPVCQLGFHRQSAKCDKLIQEARTERDQALLIARQYRNVAEATRAEKRELQCELEKKIEVVRDFWRNKVVEGGSRSGLILRAALLRK